MPAKSQAQLKFFEMLKHNPKMRKEKGVSEQVADEFTEHANYKSLPKKLSKKLKAAGKQALTLLQIVGRCASEGWIECVFLMKI